VEHVLHPGEVRVARGRHPILPALVVAQPLANPLANPETPPKPPDKAPDNTAKPAEPEKYAQNGRLWVSMNLYRFTPDIFGSCRRIRPDLRRGELELTSAVGDLVASGKTPFRVLFCKGGVLDLTSRADVAGAERALKGRRLCF
jgi:hypothetical protein